jgi:hypothetical protein
MLRGPPRPRPSVGDAVDRHDRGEEEALPLRAACHFGERKHDHREAGWPRSVRLGGGRRGRGASELVFKAWTRAGRAMFFSAFSPTSTNSASILPRTWFEISTPPGSQSPSSRAASPRLTPMR